MELRVAPVTELSTLVSFLMRSKPRNAMTKASLYFTTSAAGM
jgi:hypothetical protein